MFGLIHKWEGWSYRGLEILYIKTPYQGSNDEVGLIYEGKKGCADYVTFVDSNSNIFKQLELTIDKIIK